MKRIGIMNSCVWNGVGYVKLNDIEILVMIGVVKVMSAVCLEWDGCFQIRISNWVSARRWRRIGMGWWVRAHWWRQIQCGMWVRLCAGVKCDVVCGCALIDVVKYDVVCGFAFALASNTMWYVGARIDGVKYDVVCGCAFAIASNTVLRTTDVKTRTRIFREDFREFSKDLAIEELKFRTSKI